MTLPRIIDVATLDIFNHESWISISRPTLFKLVQRETLVATEGQLYKAVVRWAQHRINYGDYGSLREAIEEFIPKIEFEHMGVKEFLNNVVPSNTLSQEEFRRVQLLIIT